MLSLCFFFNSRIEEEIYIAQTKGLKFNKMKNVLGIASKRFKEEC
jgi:hypothetical protein